MRTPISSLPYHISQAGSYYLTGNLDGSAGGIFISEDKVTLDLMGFTIDGGGTVADHGIDFTGRSSIVIRNGVITNFGLAGIWQPLDSARYATVMDVQALANGTLGTVEIHSGIYIESSNSHVERCTAGDNGGNGIKAGVSARLINNIAYNNGYISAIYGSSGSILSGNSAYINSSTYAIYGGSGSTISGNTANFNSNWGIYGHSANLIKDNNISTNNRSATAAQGGLRHANDSRVIGNIVDGNSQNNIYVVSGDSILMENHVTDSTNGIYFTSSGNYYRDNTAAGNTNAFVNGASQTDGGGNVAF